MIEPIARTYFSQGLRLNWWDWGNEAAPPLLLIHGGLDHGRNWDWIARGLRDEYRVIAFDLRGHGESEWAKASSYPVPDFVVDVDEFLRQQKIERVKIIGHSMGGGISLLFAGVHPHRVERLVAIEGLRIFTQPKSPLHETMANWIGQVHQMSSRPPRRMATFEDALARFREAHPTRTDEQARHLTQHGLRPNEDGTFSWKYDNGIRLRAPYRLTFDQCAELWRRIECPVLLVGGGRSGRPNPAENGWVANFRNATVKTFPDAGHWVQHDHPDEIIELSRDFLKT